MILTVFACSQGDDSLVGDYKNAVRFQIGNCKNTNNCKEKLQRLMEEKGNSNPPFTKAIKEVAKDMNIELED
jgi:hypothetical protein